MNLVSIRIITNDVERLVSFYEKIGGGSDTWYTPDFAELTTPRGTLAIGSTRTVSAFGAETELQPEKNRSVIIEFLVDDVDKAFLQLKGQVPAFLREPTTMPWGNRSLLFRDPDVNLINFLTPVTPEAIRKFAQ